MSLSSLSSYIIIPSSLLPTSALYISASLPNSRMISSNVYLCVVRMSMSGWRGSRLGSSCDSVAATAELSANGPRGWRHDTIYSWWLLIWIGVPENKRVYFFTAAQIGQVAHLNRIGCNKEIYFWFKYDLEVCTTHPSFDLAGVQIHDLQIMNSTLYISETPVLITALSQTKRNVLLHYHRGLK